MVEGCNLSEVSDKAVENIVLTVGNNMMGDDGAGPLLAELLTENPVIGWHVIDGGSTPENVVHEIKALKPKRVLIVDAAEMGLEPGELGFIEQEKIAELFIMSTHNMPLSFLMDELKEVAEDVIFLGVQPQTVAFYYPMSELVKQAVQKIHQGLEQGLSDVAWL